MSFTASRRRKSHWWSARANEPTQRPSRPDEQEKICGYLLNPAHPDNGGKAQFFMALGFRVENWRALATALRELAESSPVAKSMASAHGTKYILDGRLGTPGGKQSSVRTVWIVDQGAEAPRLVTAYPRQP